MPFRKSVFMSNITKISLLFILCFALFTNMPAQQSGPDKDKPNVQDDDVVRVDTRLVTVHTSVMNRDGKFIPDISKELFHIYEDKEEQDIVFFETNNSPFTVVLMLDASDSVVFKLKDIQDAAIAFINQLRSDDRVIVVAFDANFMKLCDATSDKTKIRDAILSARTGGGTSLYGAVETTINNTLREIKGRQAIVLFTDGIDTSSRATYFGTLDLVKESNSIIYTIQYPTSDFTTKAAEYAVSQGTAVNIVTAKGEPVKLAFERGTRYLRTLSDNTSGRFYYTDTLDSLTKSFAYIAKELSQQYSVSYYPKNQDAKQKNRQIKVAVDVPKAVVKTRRSYVFK